MTILQIDPTRCEAHGFCAELLPHRIALDEWGYPLVRDGGLQIEVADADLADARRAVHACAAGALRLLSRP